jgi:hypothetical protein
VRHRASSEGAGQAAEACRKCDNGGDEPELESARSRPAAACRYASARALKWRRAKLLRQPVEVASKGGTLRAAPDVRAQMRPLDLRQLTVERERRPCTGSFALHGSDGSHVQYDGSYPASVSERTRYLLGARCAAPCALAPLRAGRGLRPGPALCFSARARWRSCACGPRPRMSGAATSGWNTPLLSQCVGAGDDLEDLLRDLRLAGSVQLQRVAIDQLARVLRRVAHSRHLRREERSR